MSNSAYPGALDTYPNPTATTFEDDSSYYHDVQHSNVNDAVHAIEATLGINPQGAYADVVTRLNALLTTASASATYQTLAGMSSYLTVATAASTYLSQSSAASTYAPLASAALTGVPTAPTATAGTNTTQIATTAFVLGQGFETTSHASATYQTISGMSSYLTTASAAATYQTIAGMSSYALLASPTFTGVPAAPTAAVDTNTTQLATTAFVIGQGYLKSATASATYSPLAGSSSIVTVGTITTGTWHGSAIANAYLANSAVTIGTTAISLGASSTTLAGLTSVTATSFVGALTGNASTVTNGVYTTDTGTVTNTMLAGSIANNKLSNSAITVNSASTALGGSVTLYAGTTALQTSSANQALAGILSVTLPGATSGSVQIIPAATAGTGTVFTLPATTGTAITSGDSGTVTNTMLANSSLTVNGTAISLGGSATVTAAAGTLTGTTLNSTVVTSSLTTVGTIGTGVWQGSRINASYLDSNTAFVNVANTFTLGQVIKTGADANRGLAIWQNSGTQSADLLTFFQSDGSTVLGKVSSAGLATFGNLNVTSSTIPSNGMYLSAANTLDIAVNGGKVIEVIANGKTALNGTAAVGAYLSILNSATGATDINGVIVNMTVQSDVTSSFRAFQTSMATQAASFTLANAYHFWARQATIGTGSAVTNQFGFRAENSLTGATTNYGFYSNLPTQANTATITNASGDGTTVTYTASNSFSPGQTVTITGMNPSAYNLTSVTINSASSTQFTVLNAATGAFVSGGTATTTAVSWNFYANGSANNYMAGSLGLGTTSLSARTLAIGKNITGATTAYGAIANGVIQSDVTSSGIYFITSSNTQATSFTLSSLYHFQATQGTIGAGSTVTTQVGFSAASSLTGGGTNIGFQGSIASASNAWNFYANGTAANYFAGQTTVGSTSLTLGASSVAQQFGVVSASATNIVEVIRGAASQSGDLTQWQSSSASILAKVSSTGAISAPQINLTGQSTTVAAIVLTSGSLLSTPVSGAIEFDGDKFYGTNNANTSGEGVIPTFHYINLTANSSAATTNTPVSVFGKALTLDAGKRYRFRGYYYATATFTSGTPNLQMLFTFSQTPVAIRYTFCTVTTTGGTANDYTAQIAVASASQVSSSISGTKTFSIEFEGFFDSNATTGGTFTPQFQMSTTGVSTVMLPGSWIEVQKIGPSGTAIVAGGWA